MIKKYDYAAVEFKDNGNTLTIFAYDDIERDHKKSTAYQKDVVIDFTGELNKLTYTIYQRTVYGSEQNYKLTKGIPYVDEYDLEFNFDKNKKLEYIYFKPTRKSTLFRWDSFFIKRDQFENFDDIKVVEIKTPVPQKFIEKLLRKEVQYNTHFEIAEEIYLIAKLTVKETEMKNEYTFTKNVKVILRDLMSIEEVIKQ